MSPEVRQKVALRRFMASVQERIESDEEAKRRFEEWKRERSHGVQAATNEKHAVR